MSERSEQMVTVARLRLGLPDGQADGVRPFYGDQLDGFWVVPLFAGDAGRVVVLHAPGGEVAAHAGLARAAATLAGLDLFGRDPAWLTANVRALLDATGGLTPGYPRYADEAASIDDDGVRLVIEAPEAWVRWAAAGAIGPAPTAGAGPGGPGIAPPAATGRMVGLVGRDGTLTWTYEVGGAVVGRFAGAAADDRPDTVDALTAESAVAAARAALASPLAVPAAPVTGGGGEHRVELLGHGPVDVPGD